MSLNQYFDTFWSNNARFGVRVYAEQTDNSNIEVSKWSSGRMVMTSVVPVHGVPFCNSTRCIKVFTIRQKSDKSIVIEADARTPDAPYGETFSVREVQMAHAGESDVIVYQRLMKLEFVKYTIFKSKIKQEATKGCIANAAKWLELAEKGGHLVRNLNFVATDSVSNVYGDETRRPLLFAPSETNLHNRNLNSLDVSGILERMTPPRQGEDGNDTLQFDEREFGNGADSQIFLNQGEALGNDAKSVKYQSYLTKRRIQNLPSNYPRTLLSLEGMIAEAGGDGAFQR